MTDIAIDPYEATLQRLGRWLIVAGVLVWGIWLVMELTGGQPQLEFFLPLHLTGVIPGSILSRWSAVRRWVKRRS